MLIDVDVNEISERDTDVQFNHGALECAIGIGHDDDGDSTTVLTFVAHRNVDVAKIDKLIGALEALRQEVVKAAEAATENTNP